MTASYLPVELWLLILSLARFSSNDLAALCLVCTGFYHALVDHLYDSIMVDSCDICTTLADYPRLAKKVKSFVFTYPRLIADDKSPTVNLEKLTLALKNMTSLSTLKLIHSRKSYSSVLRYCYAELRIFHCTYYMDRQLLCFFNRQNNIRHLAVTGNWPKDIKPKWFKRNLKSLPHLTEVSANHEWLWNFLWGRPVQTVHTVRVEGETAILSHSASPLRNLEIDLMAWRDSGVQPWTGLGLEHVEETTLTGFATRRAGMLPYCFPSLRRMLKAMPDLKRLTFWMEGKHHDARKWAENLFWKFGCMLPRLEQTLCVVVEPDMLTTVCYFKEGSCLNSNIIVDTRSHRVAGDVRELMPLPILCRWSEKQLRDRITYHTELQYYN